MGRRSPQLICAGKSRRLIPINAKIVPITKTMNASLISAERPGRKRSASLVMNNIRAVEKIADRNRHPVCVSSQN